jgi:hypothetical protein
MAGLGPSDSVNPARAPMAVRAGCLVSPGASAGPEGTGSTAPEVGLVNAAWAARAEISEAAAEAVEEASRAVRIVREGEAMGEQMARVGKFRFGNHREAAVEAEGAAAMAGSAGILVDRPMDSSR